MRYPFDLESRRPLVEIQCNERPLKCALDTGYTGWLWIHSSIARKYGIVTDDDMLKAETAGGLAPYRVGFIQFSIDEAVYPNAPAAVYFSHPLPFPLIGRNAISRCIVTIDSIDQVTDVLYMGEG